VGKLAKKGRGNKIAGTGVKPGENLIFHQPGEKEGNKKGHISLLEEGW